MKYVISSAQKEFFHKNGYLELEGLFSPEDCQVAKEEIEALGTGPEKKHDAFRQTTQVAKWVRSRAPHLLAMQIFEQKAIRIAFDHFFPEEANATLVQNLLTMSSIQPVIGGLILRLSGQKHTESPLPTAIGDVSFFAPTTPLPSFQEGAFLVIAYAKEKSQYVFNAQDPFTHQLKRLGYAFGDAVKSDTHPTIFQD